MKTKINYILFLLMLIGASLSSYGQNDDNKKSGGGKSAGSGNYAGVNNLNLGLVTYWSHSGSLAFQADYEFNLARDFTVGPSVSYSSWKNNNYNYYNIGLGARFRWYADRVLNITHPKWDVFANGDIGFNINGNNVPDGQNATSYSALWLGIGIGGKFHFNEKIGLQLIIGSGAQIGIHFGL
ncbi:hypothetical protein [Flammeovirga kamogawensis]|uniref:Porin family protein n=1 Tax=Flammeovirga kamogawensis TaxID=373891 RepID=A0ABX8GZS6_9BACT|nr:hypothetical protein [Flammeovirga kamogawensis]MBB6459564.1 hypothetical protein [Flammeovirga kamogawensis]QWG09114.1 hypothetical protein KM029_09255 [Flammeovirga kamogawensis]TRX67402.1 hypothetical protein EO216_04295 [Flammeovirga kamogawensis]